MNKVYIEEAKTDEQWEDIMNSLFGEDRDFVLEYTILSHNLRATTEQLDAKELVCSHVFLHGTYKDLALKIRYMLERYNDCNFEEKKKVTPTERVWRDNMERHMMFFLEMAEKDTEDTFFKQTVYFYCRFFGYWEDFLVIAAGENSYLVETVSHCSGKDEATVTLAR